MGARVRLVPSYLAQGPAILGEFMHESMTGVTVRDDRGIERFYPWTSVGHLVQNPDVEDASPEPF